MLACRGESTATVVEPAGDAPVLALLKEMPPLPDLR
jgi:hypothetical protein